MDIATQQNDSPVQIITVKSTTTYMFDSVELINRSERSISSITFALSIEEPQSNSQNRFSIRLRPKEVRLEGKSKVTLDAVGHQGKELARLSKLAKMTNVMATIGVVEVEFLEGDKWRYEIESEHQNRFPSKDSLRAR